MNTVIETVKSPRFEMKYFRFGSDGGEPVVILPGLSIGSVTDSTDAIVYAYQKLSEYDVYLFDRRSDIPPVYTIHDMAEDTGEAMDIIGLKGAKIIGVSQGGMIALDIAVNRPELVDRLVLGSAASHLSEELEGLISNWIHLAERKNGAVGLVGSFSRAIYTKDFRTQYKDAIDAMAQNTDDEDLARFVILAKGILDYDLRPELHKIKCPVLVLGARNDKVLGGDSSAELAEALGCESYIYDDYSHAVYDEAPDYLDKVYSFFKK